MNKQYFPGRGISIWQLKTISNKFVGASVLDGAQKAAALCADLGFDRVDIKCAEGPYQFQQNAMTPEIVKLFHDAGIQVWGWGFNYGILPIGEGQMAAQETLRLGLDGWFFDPEGRFEGQSGAVGNAHAMLRAYRAICPDVPTAACMFSHPWSPSGSVWHDPDIHEAMMQYCDFGMPMCYWYDPSVAGAVREITTAIKQWNKITDKPLVPECRAYAGDGCSATPDTILTAAEAVRADTTCIGIGWWGLDWAMKEPGWMAALKATPDYTPPPAPVAKLDWKLDVSASLKDFIAEQLANEHGYIVTTLR
jgi:hypothetical protein